MEFHIKISLDNAAFADDPDELSNILYLLSKKYRGDCIPRRSPIHDINGNNIGVAWIE